MDNFRISFDPESFLLRESLAIQNCANFKEFKKTVFDIFNKVRADVANYSNENNDNILHILIKKLNSLGVQHHTNFSEVRDIFNKLFSYFQPKKVDVLKSLFSSQNNHKITPLDLIAIINYFDLFEFLVCHSVGFNLTQSTFNHFCLYVKTEGTKYDEVIKLMLDHKNISLNGTCSITYPEANVPMNKKDTPLHLAVLNNNHLVQILAKNNDCLDWKNSEEYTPLHYALLHKAPAEIIKTLIISGCDPKALGRGNRTAFQIAEQFSNSHIKALMKIVQDINQILDLFTNFHTAEPREVVFKKLFEEEISEQVFENWNFSTSNFKQLTYTELIRIQDKYRARHSHRTSTLSGVQETLLGISIDQTEDGQDYVIGEGSFGKVYRGKYGTTTVVLKEIKIQKEYSYELNKEVSILSKLRHPNCVLFLGIFASKYLVMEYCENGSLLKWIRTQPSVTYIKKLEIAKGISQGVYYLHSLGIIHRDLSARNIVLDKGLTPKVADYGLSKIGDVYQGRDETKRPVLWCSPEAIGKHVFSKASDIYSFGVLLWELITNGKIPYCYTETPIQEIIQGRCLPLDSNFTESFSYLLRWMWAYDADKRPNAFTVDRFLETMLNQEKSLSRASLKIIHNEASFFSIGGDGYNVKIRIPDSKPADIINMNEEIQYNNMDT